MWSQALAEQVGSGDSLETALGNISIKLGGGKKSVSAAACVPTCLLHDTADAGRCTGKGSEVLAAR